MGFNGLVPQFLWNNANNNYSDPLEHEIEVVLPILSLFFIKEKYWEKLWFPTYPSTHSRISKYCKRTMIVMNKRFVALESWWNCLYNNAMIYYWPKRIGWIIPFRLSFPFYAFYLFWIHVHFKNWTF